MNTWRSRPRRLGPNSASQEPAPRAVQRLLPVSVKQVTRSTGFCRIPKVLDALARKDAMLHPK